MFSKNLRYYRLKAGMTKCALAEACGISPMSVTHYEAGDRAPSMPVLESLARVLGVGLADLLRRRNADLSFQHGDFRKAPHMSAADQDLVRESVEEYFGRFFDAVEAIGGDVLPPFPPCGAVSLTDDPEADAAALRRHLMIESIGPVGNLVEALEDRGVLVMPLASDCEGFYGISGSASGRPYIAVNLRAGFERCRSTIAHELAHLMFAWPSDMPAADRERRATAIGGAFLFPAADAKRELGPRRSAITNDMGDIAKKYGVSISLLAKRAHLVGIIGDAAYRRFRSAVAQQSDSPRTSIPPETPRLFEKLVYRAVCEDDISIQRGAELLDCGYVIVADECAPFGA